MYIALFISLALTTFFAFLGNRARNKWKEKNPYRQDRFFDLFNLKKLMFDYYARNDGSAWYLAAFFAALLFILCVFLLMFPNFSSSL